MTSGEVVKAEIPHGRPSGMEGFVFNTRRPIFQDWRVRDALLHAFNYEFVNQTLNGGACAAAGELFRQLGARRWATGRRRGGWPALLEPFAGELRRTRSTPTRCRSRTGRRATAKNMRIAAERLEEAGWTVRDGVLQNAEGKPFAFRSCSSRARTRRWPTIFVDALRQLGIEARVKLGRRRRSTTRARTTTTTT